MFCESNLALGYIHRNWMSYSCCGHCKMLHTELPFLQCSIILSDRSLDADPLCCAILLTLSDLFLLTQYHVLKHRSTVFNLGNSASSICVWEEKYKILQNIQFSHNVRDITVTHINVKILNWQTPQKYKITFSIPHSELFYHSPIRFHRVLHPYHGCSHTLSVWVEVLVGWVALCIEEVCSHFSIGF